MGRIIDDGAHPIVTFGGLRVPTDAAVIRPRPWTPQQSIWAEELSSRCSPGPILDLFAGSGHIGLEASRRTGRPAMLVDQSWEACQLASETTRVNRLDASVLNARVSIGLCTSISPGVILADPPYVPRSEVGHFPADPVLAIDGGPDGLSITRALLQAVKPILRAEVPLILQLRGPDQADTVSRWLNTEVSLGMGVEEVRCFGTDRALALIRSTAP
jgi:methylase of polypeptide subunit release factors